MVVIVTPEEIIEGTINPDLIDLYDTPAGKASLAKYENIVASKVRAKINSDQFKKEDGTYEIPDDLKMATISLIDSYYIYAVVNKENSASKKVTEKKIDDFTIRYSDNESAFSYFGIPTDGDILDILKKYMGTRERGYRDVDIR